MNNNQELVLGQLEDATHPPHPVKKSNPFIQLAISIISYHQKLITNMIIKKETTRLQHPSPAKGTSFSFEKYQDLLQDSKPLPSPRMITRTDSMVLHKSMIRKNSTREMLVARRRHASKEMVRRALTPPARRLTWRWFDFRPTPSRLSVMSMAI